MLDRQIGFAAEGVCSAEHPARDARIRIQLDGAPQPPECVVVSAAEQLSDARHRVPSPILIVGVDGAKRDL